MDIAAIDYWAYSGSSFLHRSSAAAKLVMMATILAAIILGGRPYALITLYGVLLLVLLATGLPVLKVLVLSAYPVMFTALFVLSRWDGNWGNTLVLFLKTMGAALSALLLIGTTPYPEVFGCLGRFLPRVLTDGLFLTYRSLFVLLKELDRLVTAFRIRGGWTRTSLIRRIDNLATALGLLLIKALNQSQRQYAVMLVRGYQGKLAEERPAFTSWRADLPPVCLGGAVLTLSLLLRG